MKKIILPVFILISLVCSSAFGFQFHKNRTMTVDEFLHTNKTNKDWKTLKLNKNGDVIFKNKLIIKSSGDRLNRKTAYTDTEYRIYFAAAKIKPRKGCDPDDTENNGSLGCYIDNPDE